MEISFKSGTFANCAFAGFTFMIEELQRNGMMQLPSFIKNSEMLFHGTQMWYILVENIKVGILVLIKH